MPKKSASENIQVALRIDPSVLDRADALLELAREMTGSATTRSDVLRLALMRGLRALEHERDKR